MALRPEEREAHAAADEEGVDSVEQRADDAQLVAHLRPAQDGHEREPDAPSRPLLLDNGIGGLVGSLSMAYMSQNPNRAKIQAYTGTALGLRARGMTAARVFVLIGDGELDEGSNHEAIAFAGRMALEGLVCVIVDNRSSSRGWPGGIASRFATRSP